MDSQKIEFIPFQIYKKYSHCSSSVEETVLLFDEFETKVNVQKKCFDRVIYKLVVQHPKLGTKEKIIHKLESNYVIPIYFSFEKIRVWKIGKVYLSFGFIDSYPYGSELVMILTYTRPSVFCLYENYVNETKDLMNIPKRWNLEFKHKPFFLSKRKYLCILENSQYQYTIIKGRYSAELISSKKEKISEGIKIIPDWKQKIKYKNDNEFATLLESFFLYMEEYDINLKKIDK